MNKKQSFTLLELMVCLALLAVLGGFFALKGNQMIAHYRFERAAHNLFSEISLLKSLSSAYQADIELKIEMSDNTLQCRASSDETALSSKIRLYHNVKFKPISAFLFENQNKKDLTVTFTSSGWIEPRGTITLSLNDETQSLNLKNL